MKVGLNLVGRCVGIEEIGRIITEDELVKLKWVIMKINSDLRIDGGF